VAHLGLPRLLARRQRRPEVHGHHHLAAHPLRQLKGAFVVQTWTIFACAAAITLGILSGGWRIVRTVGFGIYKVRPLHALDAQLTSAAVIYGASLLGAPVSTTHVVSSSIMGIGASERVHAVRWAKAQEILTTWVITIPGAALVSILAYLISAIFIR